MEQTTVPDTFRHIVRVADTDLNGNRKLHIALQKIKGISDMYAHAVCVATGIPENTKTGTLSDAQTKQLGEVIQNPASLGIPRWLYNRRNDPASGADKHVLTSDLSFLQENDIRMLKMIRCYRGIRHSYGQPVRGQRTRSNFRKNKGKVMGVQRKAVVAKAAGKEEKGKK